MAFQPTHILREPVLTTDPGSKPRGILVPGLEMEIVYHSQERSIGLYRLKNRETFAVLDSKVEPIDHAQGFTVKKNFWMKLDVAN